MECPDPVVAYKEWAPVVARLGTGAQVLLLRKGGIAEGPGGFRPEHGWFWLHPTQFHAAAEKLKPEVDVALAPPPGWSLAARVEEARWLENERDLPKLDPFHGWAAQEVRRRFEFGKRRGLYALVVRVWRSEDPRPLPPEEETAGCRSWIEASPRPGVRRWSPVMDQESFTRRLQAVRVAWA